MNLPAGDPSMKSVSPRSKIESSPSMAEEAELPPWPNADSDERFMGIVEWTLLNLKFQDRLKWFDRIFGSVVLRWDSVYLHSI